MKHMNKKVIIFDFDGVFVSDYNFHKEHIERFIGQKISEKDFYNVHSGNVYNDDGKGLELGQFDMRSYCKSIKNDFIAIPLVEGMRETISHARTYGDVYIVSSGCECNIKSFLVENQFDVNHFIVYGVETSPSKKIKFERIITQTGISPQDMIFITDTLGDMKEAADMDIASIGVTWGFQRVDTLEQGAPFGFAHKAVEISDLIDTYFDISDHS